MPNWGTLCKRQNAQSVLYTNFQCGRSTPRVPIETNLKQLRKAKQLSQTALAEAVGTTLNMYGKLERGQRRLNSDWLVRLAEALGVKPEEIIAELEPESEADGGLPTPTVSALREMIAEHYRGVMKADMPDEMLGDLTERVFDSISNWKEDPAAACDPQVARSVARQINRQFDR